VTKNPLGDPVFIVKVASAFFNEADESLKHIKSISQGDAVLADLRKSLDLLINAHSQAPDAIEDILQVRVNADREIIIPIFNVR